MSFLGYTARMPWLYKESCDRIHQRRVEHFVRIRVHFNFQLFRYNEWLTEMFWKKINVKNFENLPGKHLYYTVFILKMFPSHVYIWKFTEIFPKICLEYISIKGIISGNFIGSTTSINDMILRKYFTDILIIWLLTLSSPGCLKYF